MTEPGNNSKNHRLLLDLKMQYLYYNEQCQQTYEMAESKRLHTGNLQKNYRSVTYSFNAKCNESSDYSLFPSPLHTFILVPSFRIFYINDMQLVT